MLAPTSITEDFTNFPLGKPSLNILRAGIIHDADTNSAALRIIIIDILFDQIAADDVKASFLSDQNYSPYPGWFLNVG